MIDTLPLPAAMRRRLSEQLPGRPGVLVTPRDKAEKVCPAWCADHYEIAAFYTSMGHPLAELADAVAALSGVYRVTVIRDGVVAEDWPVHYRSTSDLRPQVRALMRDSKR